MEKNEFILDRDNIFQEIDLFNRIYRFCEICREIDEITELLKNEKIYKS